MKCGMVSMWDAWGTLLPLTVLSVDLSGIVQNKVCEKTGRHAVVVGSTISKMKNADKARIAACRAAGFDRPFKHLAEFQVTPECMIDAGTTLYATHFVPGQHVDVKAVSRGKGFAGVMKKWGYKGQPASHGATKSHRSPGSIGRGTDPGRVFKGTKMAGRMGGKSAFVRSLLVHKVDPQRNLIFVKGAVPGPQGAMVRVTDAMMKRVTEEVAGQLPMPTWTPEVHMTDDVFKRHSFAEGPFVNVPEKESWGEA